MNTEISRRTFLKQVALAGLTLGFPEGANPAAAAAGRAPLRKKSGYLLASDEIYLNSGALGATPATVFQELTDCMEHLEKSPAHVFHEEMQGTEAKTREILAQVLKTSPEEIALTRNTTEGLRIAAQSLPLQRGDEVMISDQEFPTAVITWEHMAEAKGIKLIAVPSPRNISQESIVKVFEQRVSKRTRVISMVHIASESGQRFPIKQLAKLAHTAGAYLIVDGAQTFGMISCDVRDLGCDFYASCGHKWLGGPKETGVLYIRKDILPKLTPPFLSQKTIQSWKVAPAAWQFEPMLGTRNLCALVGLASAARHHENVGVHQTENTIRALVKHLKKRVMESSRLTLLTPEPWNLSGGLVTVKIPSDDVIAVYRQLMKSGIQVSPAHGSHGIRFSPHIFNTQKDLDRAIEMLEKLT